jgi:hypothetical protein
MLMDWMVVATTITLALSDLPPALARRNTLPALTPRTDPAVTTATEASLVDHATGGLQRSSGSPLLSNMASASDVLDPTRRLNDCGVICSLATLFSPPAQMSTGPLGKPAVQAAATAATPDIKAPRSFEGVMDDRMVLERSS